MAGGEVVITYKRKRCQKPSSSDSGHVLNPSDRSENSAVRPAVIEDASRGKFVHKKEDAEVHAICNYCGLGDNFCHGCSHKEKPRCILHSKDGSRYLSNGCYPGSLCHDDTRQKQFCASMEVEGLARLKEKEAESHGSRHASYFYECKLRGNLAESMDAPFITFTRRSKKKSDFGWKDTHKLPHDRRESCLQSPSSKSQPLVFSRGNFSKNYLGNNNMPLDAGISTQDVVRHLVSANGPEMKKDVQTVGIHSGISPCKNQGVTVEAENFMCTKQKPLTDTEFLEGRHDDFAIPSANIPGYGLDNNMSSGSKLKNLHIAMPGFRTSTKAEPVEVEEIVDNCGSGRQQAVSLDLHITHVKPEEALDIDSVDKHIQDPPERPVKGLAYETHNDHRTLQNLSPAGNTFDLMRNIDGRATSNHSPIYGSMSRNWERACPAFSSGIPSSTCLQVFVDAPTNTSSHPIGQCSATPYKEQVRAFLPSSMGNKGPIETSNGLFTPGMPFPSPMSNFHVKYANVLPALPLPFPSSSMNPVYPITHMATRPEYDNGSSLFRHKMILDSIIDRARAMQGCRGSLHWSEDELDYLWIGVRRHGNNWHAILADPKLRFAPWRVPNDLSEKWREERNKVLSDWLRPQSGLRFGSTPLHPASGTQKNSMGKDTQLSLGDVYCHKQDRIPKMPLEKQRQTARPSTSAGDCLPHWLRGTVRPPWREVPEAHHFGVVRPCQFGPTCAQQDNVSSARRPDIPQLYTKKSENVVDREASSEETISDDRC